MPEIISIFAIFELVIKLGIVADPVIEAFARSEFEYGLRMRVGPPQRLLVPLWHLAQDLFPPLKLWVGLGDDVVVICGPL